MTMTKCGEHNVVSLIYNISKKTALRIMIIKTSLLQVIYEKGEIALDMEYNVMLCKFYDIPREMSSLKSSKP